MLKRSRTISAVELACINAAKGHGSADTADASHFVFTGQLVLPDSQHSPVRTFQSLFHHAIPGQVSSQFGTPKGTVGLRAGAVQWAGMPKASIYENSQPLLDEHEIGVPENRTIAAPAFYSPFAEEGQQPEFGGLVALRPDSRHDRRALIARKNIRHVRSGVRLELSPFGLFAP
jgi:hypothetical protein